MTARPVASVLLALSALSVACDFRGAADDLVAPASVFTAIEVLPRPITLWETESVELRVRALDQRKHLFAAAGTWSFVSSDPTVATVSDSGVVTGVAAGTADIVVTTTVAGVAHNESVRATVRHATPADSVHIVAGRAPWEPSAAHIKTGGTVRWTATDSIAWSGTPHRTLYLMDGRYRHLESFDLRTGSVSRRFPTAGVYRYCSGPCWDPPDYGVVIVR